MFTYARNRVEASKRSVAIYGLSAILITLAMLLYIYPSIRSTSLMYEYADALSEKENQVILNKKIRLEISTLKSYDFIEKYVTEKLGFTMPAQGQVVIIGKK
jgi:cell division protein FtsL